VVSRNDSIAVRLLTRATVAWLNSRLNWSSLQFVRIAVLDTETTGLPPGARIVEVGVTAVDLRARQIGEYRGLLIDPQCPIPESATRVHGIRDRDVRGRPTIDRVLPRLLEYLARFDAVAAHFARFDCRVIREEASRVGVTLPGTLRVLCTRELARAVFLNASGYSLETLCSHLRIQRAGPHRTRGDTHDTARLILEIDARAPIEQIAAQEEKL
jgi:DNA polymerase III, epsilon subunit and related 3'-5' exonucleases